MSPARKLLLLVAVSLAAMASASSSATAAITILEEEDPGNGNHACPTLVQNGNTISGGCHVAVSSTAQVTMVVHTGPGEVVISSCNVAGEARGATDGTGFVVEQVLTDSTPGSCTRRPCAGLPWPAAIEDAGATTTAELTFCLTLPAGGSGTWCTVHRQGSDLGSHNYTSVASEVACEGAPSIELIGNLVTFFPGTERAEVIND